MKTLVVHPADPTTNFLSRIYARLKDKTVVNGGVSKSELQELIESHDRVICLGHGSPYGLLSQHQFSNVGLYVIDETLASILKTKSDSLFIWCYADQFVQQNRLFGLSSGMFISEIGEANYWRFEDIDQAMIDQSNVGFASIVSKYIDEPIEVMYNKLLIEYEEVAMVNPIAKFNLARLQLITDGMNNNRIRQAV